MIFRAVRRSASFFAVRKWTFLLSIITLVVAALVTAFTYVSGGAEPPEFSGYQKAFLFVFRLVSYYIFFLIIKVKAKAASNIDLSGRAWKLRFFIFFAIFEVVIVQDIFVLILQAAGG